MASEANSTNTTCAGVKHTVVGLSDKFSQSVHCNLVLYELLNEMYSGQSNELLRLITLYDVI